MSRVITVCLVVGAVAAFALWGATAGRAGLVGLLGPEREALVYDGNLSLDAGGIKITSWGSGSYKSVYEKSYIGPEVLKITSQGPNQGVVLHLGRPVDLAPFLAANESYLDLRILPAQVPKPKEEPEGTLTRRTGGLRTSRTSRTSRTGGTGTTGGATGTRGRASGGAGGPAGRRGGGGRMGQAEPGQLQIVLTGAMGGMGGGRRGGGGAMGGRGGMGAGGAGGRRGGGGTGGRQGQRGQTTPGAPGQGQQQAPGVIAFSLSRLRLVLFTDQGTMMADSPAVGLAPNDERGWVPVTVALASFHGGEWGKSLEAIGIFANQADTFYLGRVRLIVDRTEVKPLVTANPSITRTGQLISFAANLSGPAEDAEVSWDFDKADPGKHLAAGRFVKYIYKKPGDYLVTCTIEDRAGVRPPVVKTIGVHVEAAPAPEEALQTPEGIR
jgi:hypothetical protein